MLEFLTYASFALAGFVILFSFFFRNKISRFIRVDKLGVIERDLSGLVQVVVVANEVEKPTSTLQSAVEENFKKGVKYLFLVSNSNAISAVNGYYNIFEALAKISKPDYVNNFDIDSILEIKRLPYDWPDVPYIFYQYIQKKSSQSTITAFRGNQKGEGIADYYEQVSALRAEAMFLSLLNEAPLKINQNTTFTEIKNIKFPTKTAHG